MAVGTRRHLTSRGTDRPFSRPGGRAWERSGAGERAGTALAAPVGAAWRRPGGLTTTDVLALQRAVGNQAVGGLLCSDPPIARPAHTRRGPNIVVQRRLVPYGQQYPGYYYDDRDQTQPALSFTQVQGGYREHHSGVVYNYLANTDQFVDPQGQYFDPYYRQTFVPVPQYQGWYWHATGYYQYDGAYYRPVPQQQPQQQPQPQPTAQATAPTSTTVTGQTQQSTSGGRSGGQMSNDDFRAMLLGGGFSGSSMTQALSAESTLTGTLATIEQEATRSGEALMEAIRLVCAGSHARGVKGLAARLEDHQRFSQTDRGHAYASWATFQTYLRLIQRLAQLRGKLPPQYDLQQQCRSAGFDKKPKDDFDPPGKGRGSATYTPKARLSLGTWT